MFWLSSNGEIRDSGGYVVFDLSNRLINSVGTSFRRAGEIQVVTAKIVSGRSYYSQERIIAEYTM